VLQRLLLWLTLQECHVLFMTTATTSKDVGQNAVSDTKDTLAILYACGKLIMGAVRVRGLLHATDTLMHGVAYIV